MLRPLLSAVVLVMTTMPVSTDVNCGNAYVTFLERLSRREEAVSADRLVTLHRSALRILDACDSGHMDNPEPMLRDLEQS